MACNSISPRIKFNCIYPKNFLFTVYYWCRDVLKAKGYYYILQLFLAIVQFNPFLESINFAYLRFDILKGWLMRLRFYLSRYGENLTKVIFSLVYFIPMIYRIFQTLKALLYRWKYGRNFQKYFKRKQPLGRRYLFLDFSRNWYCERDNLFKNFILPTDTSQLEENGVKSIY